MSGQSLSSSLVEPIPDVVNRAELKVRRKEEKTCEATQEVVDRRGSTRSAPARGEYERARTNLGGARAEA